MSDPNFPIADHPLADRLIEAVAAWARRRQDVRGLALVGSHARGEARIDSDIDFALLVTDPDVFRTDDAWLDAIAWERLGLCVARWQDEDNGVAWSRRVWLRPEGEIELTFARPSWAALTPIDPGTRRVILDGCRILHDPDDSLNRLDLAVKAPARGVVIRPATAADAQPILEAHRAAVLQTAAASYASDILIAWAAPLDPDNVQRMAGQIASRAELLLVAELEGKIAGFGSIVPKNGELRAVYVHPDHGRIGIGGRILAELESLAREHGLPELAMDASLNAEDFYAKRGFGVVEQGEHALRGGARMRCVKMRKAL